MVDWHRRQCEQQWQVPEVSIFYTMKQIDVQWRYPVDSMNVDTVVGNTLLWSGTGTLLLHQRCDKSIIPYPLLAARIGPHCVCCGNRARTIRSPSGTWENWRRPGMVSGIWIVDTVGRSSASVRVSSVIHRPIVLVVDSGLTFRVKKKLNYYDSIIQTNLFLVIFSPLFIFLLKSCYRPAASHRRGGGSDGRRSLRRGRLARG